MKNIVRVLGLCLIVGLYSFIAEWVTVENRPGKFKMLFPRQPQESEQTLKTAIGPLTMKFFMHDAGKYKDDNLAYALMWADYPDTMVNSDFKDELVDDFFSNAIKGAAKNMNGTIMSTKVISLKGYPGRQALVSVTENKAIMNMKAYLVHNRCYILEVCCDKDKEGNASIDKFFNSFTLLP